MSLSDDFTTEFNQLDIALDRASAIANRLFRTLDAEAGHPVRESAVPVPREAIQDELRRLQRVADELKIHAARLRGDSTNPGGTVDNALDQWIQIRELYTDARDAWSNLGETLTSSMALHIGSQYPQDTTRVRASWGQHFPLVDDVETAMALVEGNLDDWHNVYLPDTTTARQQELSDRYLLQLRHSMGLAQSRIGKLTGVGQAATATRLNRALERLILRVAMQRLRATVERDALKLSPWHDSYVGIPSALRNIGVQISGQYAHATAEFLKDTNLHELSDLDFFIQLITLPSGTLDGHRSEENVEIFDSLFSSTINSWNENWSLNQRSPIDTPRIGVIALYSPERPLQLVNLHDFWDLLNTHGRREQGGGGYPLTWDEFDESGQFKQSLIEIADTSGVM